MTQLSKYTSAGRIVNIIDKLAAFPVNISNHLSTLFTKLSILCFYLRFAISRKFRIAVHVLMIIIILAYTLGASGGLFFCRPMSFFWEYMPYVGTPGYNGPKGTCIDADGWYAWLMFLNCITDGILLLMPIWIIRPLRIPRAQKIVLAAILGTGGL